MSIWDHHHKRNHRSDAVKVIVLTIAIFSILGTIMFKFDFGQFVIDILNAVG